MLEEKSFGKTQNRAIWWTKDGPKRLCLRGIKENSSAKSVLAHFGIDDEKIERQLREVNFSEIQNLACTEQESAMIHSASPTAHLAVVFA